MTKYRWLGENVSLTEGWKVAKINISSKVRKDSLPCPGPEPVEPAPAWRGAECVSWEGAGGQVSRPRPGVDTASKC